MSRLEPSEDFEQWISYLKRTTQTALGVRGPRAEARRYLGDYFNNPTSMMSRPRIMVVGVVRSGQVLDAFGGTANIIS